MIMCAPLLILILPNTLFILSSFTGTSGTLSWELENTGVHIVIMWSVPYNLNIYNSYFGIGVVQLKTKFTPDMLTYWYDQMIKHR